MTLKNIDQCDVKHMILPIKTITSVVNVSTYIITGITAHLIGLAVILEIMSVSTFKSAIILYIYTYVDIFKEISDLSVIHTKTKMDIFLEPFTNKSDVSFSQWKIKISYTSSQE